MHARPADDTPAPLLLLLHGFPEFWYSWRHQIPALVEAGFHVVAPDLRGYNLSGNPSDVADYRVEVLAADIEELVRFFGAKRAHVVGHDWGGMVGWWFGMRHQDRLERLTVLNCPHPEHQLAMMRDAAQVRKSRYMLLFQLPFGVAERAMRNNDFAKIRQLLARDPERGGAFTEQDIERYVAALCGDTPRCAMHYYRALLRRSPWALRRQLSPIDRPVQVIWGARDRHLGLQYSRPSARRVGDLRYDTVPDASHWVQVDRPDAVNRLLVDFRGAP